MASSNLTEGDTVGLTGEVTMVHDDGTVTISLHGYVYPLTLRPSICLLSRNPRSATGQATTSIDARAPQTH